MENNKQTYNDKDLSKILADIFIVVGIFLPFSLIISLGDTEIFLTILFLVMPFIISIYIFRNPKTIIAAIIMIIFTLCIK